MGPHYLDRLFAPKSIAAFGASERPDAVGARVFRNLIQGNFAGPIYTVNPKYKTVQGRDCHPSIAAVGHPVDLAVIATPATTVPGIIHECGEHHVKAAIVLSAGLGEIRGEGAALQKTMLDGARRYGLRILGPNCLGLMRPEIGLNATFSNNSARLGSLALVSQSGALCTAILDWAASQQIGFSAIVSLGDAADVGFGDVLDLLRARSPDAQHLAVC